MTISNFFIFIPLSCKANKHYCKTELISAVKNSTQEQIAIREKREAIRFLKENGIAVWPNVNYASRQPNKEEFWINPSVKALNSDWMLILNNQYSSEIIVLCIPAHSFVMRPTDKDGLYARHDQPKKIDLNIRVDNLSDTRSKKSFVSFVSHRIKY